MSYETVLQIDNTITRDVLEKYKDNGNVFVLQNMQSSTNMYKYIFLFFFWLSNLRCKAVLPPYLPILENNNFKRADLVEQYYNLGLNYNEIVVFLGLLHGCILSTRQLKRILRQHGLGRRRNHSDIEHVNRAIQRELRGSGSMMGYRLITSRLLHGHCVVVDKETVRELF